MIGFGYGLILILLAGASIGEFYYIIAQKETIDCMKDDIHDIKKDGRKIRKQFHDVLLFVDNLKTRTEYLENINKKNFTNGEMFLQIFKEYISSIDQHTDYICLYFNNDFNNKTENDEFRLPKDWWDKEFDFSNWNKLLDQITKSDN